TSLTNSGAITASNINLQATSSANNGSITLGAAVGSATATVSLTSYSSIADANLNGDVTANTLNLTSQNSFIGSSNGATLLSVAAPNVSASAATSAYITDSATGTVTITGGSANTSTGTFEFVAPNATSLTNTGAITASGINLQATSSANNGSISLGASVGSATSTVSLTSYNSIADSNLNGDVTANTLNVTSQNSFIGSSNGASSLTVSAANLSASASTSAY